MELVYACARRDDYRMILVIILQMFIGRHGDRCKGIPTVAGHKSGVRARSGCVISHTSDGSRFLLLETGTPMVIARPYRTGHDIKDSCLVSVNIRRQFDAAAGEAVGGVKDSSCHYLPIGGDWNRKRPRKGDNR